MNVHGITWHAITTADVAAWRTLATGTLGLTPVMENPGFLLFQMPNGTMLEVYAPDAVPDYGYNGSIAFGFRVDDIEAASRALADAGCELLGEINRVQELKYAYRHFRGPDGAVYGLNQQG